MAPGHLARPGSPSRAKFRDDNHWKTYLEDEALGVVGAEMHAVGEESKAPSFIMGIKLQFITVRLLKF